MIRLLLTLALLLPLTTASQAATLAKWCEPRRVEWSGKFWEEWQARYFVLEEVYIPDPWGLWGGFWGMRVREVTEWEWGRVEVKAGS